MQGRIFRAALPTIAARACSEIRGSLSWKNPEVGRTRATGQLTPRNSSAVGALDDICGESWRTAPSDAFGW
ncbi:hypothetical protein BH23ACT11_BH23ACT11_11340 [soil metagenome]